MIIINTPPVYAEHLNDSVSVTKPFDVSEPIDEFELLKLLPEQKEKPINVSYEVDAKTCKIKFNKISSYSVYYKTVLADTLFSQRKPEKYCFFAAPKEEGEMVNGYYAVGSCINSNQLKIENMAGGRTHNIYVFEGLVPDESHLLQELNVTIKPDVPTFKIKESNSKKVKLSFTDISCPQGWIEIFKNGKKISTISSEETEFIDSDVKPNSSYKYQIRCYIKNTQGDKVYSDKSKTKSVKIYQSMGTPNVSGVCKTWANYQAVTVKSSPQYKLLHSDACYTDKKTGIRMVDDCYCVALGSYYGSKIGQKYLIKLSSGKEFKAILCDQKADRHTDATHRYAVQNKDIVEFYIDRAYKPSAVDGSYNALPQFRGNIVSIEKIN